MPETRFVEATGKSFNTVYPNDFGFWELVDELVQQEPPGASDPEILGLLASVGIVHGKPFEPDERMRKILEEAVVVGNATARTVTFAARPEEGFAFYPGSAWESALFVGGYEFLDPPPQITADGVVAAQSDGARKLDSRTNFFYMATGITPAMCMRLTGIGSQYIYAMRDSEGEYFDGARELPPHASARHPREPLLVGDHLRPPDPLDAADGSTPASPRQPIRHGRDEPRWLDRHLLRADSSRRQGVATGSRPFPARAGGRSFGSTTRCSRSSTRAGGRARSSPWTRRTLTRASLASAGSRPLSAWARLPGGD